MVLVFFAEGFEEVEALSVVDVLRRVDISVEMIGISGKTIRGAHGVQIVMDKTLEEISYTDQIDALVLPGGMPGATNLIASEKLGDLLKKGASNSIPIAAICAAPSVLAYYGIYEGRRATCYPGFESKMDSYIHVTDQIVRDGPLITGKGVGVALAFGLELVKVLKSEPESDSLKSKMIL